MVVSAVTRLARQEEEEVLMVVVVVVVAMAVAVAVAVAVGRSGSGSGAVTRLARQQKLKHRWQSRLRGAEKQLTEYTACVALQYTA